MLIKPSDFAAELAKKLGGNIPASNTSNKPTEEETPRPKTVPSFRPSASEISAQVKKVTGTYLPILFLYCLYFVFRNVDFILGNIFLDEPPPLDAFENIGDDDYKYSEADETDDFMSSNIFETNSKSAKDSLFGNRPNFGGLFDKFPDNADDKAAPEIKSVENKVTNNLFDDFDEFEKPSLFTKSDKPENKKQTSSLFEDDDDNTEDELFKSISTKPTSNKNPIKASNNINKPKHSALFGDSTSDDEDLFKETKNTPVRFCFYYLLRRNY